MANNTTLPQDGSGPLAGTGGPCTPGRPPARHGDRTQDQNDRAAAFRTGLLQVLNRHSDLREGLAQALALVREFSGVDAVGVRVRDGNDYPYFETNGFSGQFVKRERSLCALAPDGSVCRDEAGRPVLACVCGSVLTGERLAGTPGFTPGGSFVAKSTRRLLADGAFTGGVPRLRGYCAEIGYQTVAVIPLRALHETVGLLQLNDRAEDALSDATVATLEEAASSIAMAVSRWLENQHLSAARMFAERILAVASDEVAVFDRDMRVIFANTAFLQAAGVAEADLVGRTCRELGYSGAGSPGMEGALAQARRLGMPVSLECTMPAAGGGRRYYCTFVPMQDDQPEPPVALLRRDLTLQRQIEIHRLEFEQNNRVFQVGKLISTVAHDIRNPAQFVAANIRSLESILPALVAQLDRAAAEHGDFPVGQTSYKDIRGELPMLLRDADCGVRQIVALTERLRGYLSARVAEPAPFDFNAAVEQSAFMMRTKLSLVTDRFEVALAPGLPPVTGDRYHLQQALVNLLDNAHAAITARDQPIRVSTTATDDGQWVVLAVSDGGCGMSEQVRRRAVEPFFTTRRETGGTGLGLTLCHDVAVAHGGSLTIESTEGSGTRVTMTLPVRRKE